MRRATTIVSALLFSFWLPACGGGGGGGGLPAATFPITTQSALAVAELVLGGGTEIEGLEAGLEQLGEQLGFDEPGTFPCPDGGTYTVVAGRTTGSVTFDDCGFDFGDGVSIVNGTLSFREIGDSVIEITLDLTVQDNGETFGVTGDMRIEFRDAGANAETVILSGDELTFTDNGNSLSLEDYRFAETVDFGTGQYTATQRGTFRTSQLGGTVNFRTISPLTGTVPDEPTGGILEVEGALGSVMTLTITGPNVLVETDEDGDGQIDESFTTTWEDLVD